jgi:hypothetical protein
MKCLFCENEFANKRETAKFCSTNCRVKWHNKHGGSKSGEVKKSTLQVLVNRMMDRLDKIEAAEPTPTVLDAPKYKPIFDEPLQYTKPKIKRSYENYQQLKLDCDSIESWEELKNEILNSDLPKQQKILLIT